MAYHFKTQCIAKFSHVVYDMQFKSTEVQCVMWTKLNQVMFKFGLANPNFKGFMVDSA